MGRPSIFTQALADEICGLIADGHSLRAICRREDMPDARTVHRWIAADAEFCQQYARAKEAQADHYAEEIIEIADDGTNDWTERQLGEDGPTISVVDHEHIARSKLRVDARKWIAARLAPKKWGDKLVNEHTGNLEITKIECVIVDPKD